MFSLLDEEDVHLLGQLAVYLFKDKCNLLGHDTFQCNRQVMYYSDLKLEVAGSSKAVVQIYQGVTP